MKSAASTPHFAGLLVKLGALVLTKSCSIALLCLVGIRCDPLSVTKTNESSINQSSTALLFHDEDSVMSATKLSEQPQLC